MNLFFLIILFFMGMVSLKADEGPFSDEEFISQLNGVKNPFVADLPKPVVVPKPLEKHPEAVPRPAGPVAVLPQEVVSLPDLRLEGVVVGDGIRQAIINDQVVTLQGTIKGARVISVTKDGVGLLFKGKKFFLKAN